MRVAGYSDDSIRAAESQTLRATPHYFTRSLRAGQTVYHMWACATCGNERIYGADEP